MKKDSEGGSNIGRVIIGKTIAGLSLRMILLIAITISIASASIQSDILNNVSPIYVIGDHTENIVIDRPVTIIGINDPVLRPANANIDTIEIVNSSPVITGLVIKGNSGANAISIYNSSPVIMYNNISGNNVGARNYIYNASPTADARYNYWGDSGVGPLKGSPGGSDGNTNNPVIGDVAFSPWLTGSTANGRILITHGSGFILNNPDAGVNLNVIGGVGSDVIAGSAKYLSKPYTSTDVPDMPVRFADVFVSTVVDGTATITMAYASTDASYVVPSSLKMYVWNGMNWIEPADLTRNDLAKTVSGTFSTSVLNGAIVALSGKDYSVTISPAQNPSVPISNNPVFSTFKIESIGDIKSVYYQVDNYSGTWIPIQQGINAKTWNWPNWNASASVWQSLGQGTHTYYFKFSRNAGSDVGNNGEISWQFFKTGPGPVPAVIVTSPKNGDTLTRDPFDITWTLPSMDDVAYIALTYSRDGGKTYPYKIDTITGADTGYAWRSPNIGTSMGKIKVTVVYNNGDKYSGVSDGLFTIAKGYSFHSYAIPGTSFHVEYKPPFSFHIG